MKSEKFDDQSVSLVAYDIQAKKNVLDVLSYVEYSVLKILIFLKLILNY